VLFAETTICITNGEWEPYLSQYSYKYGLASQIVSEAFRLEDINIEWGFYPWARAYQNAKQGIEWYASAVWCASEDAKKDFLLSEPMVKTSNVYFHLKINKFDWKTVEDLKGLRIGITRGYDYRLESMTALKLKKIETSVVTSDEQNFGMLLLGCIDIFPDNPIVGYSQIKNNFSPDCILTCKSVYTLPESI
jgi:polar amino acid transport system substrate-binding protein